MKKFAFLLSIILLSTAARSEPTVEANVVESDYVTTGLGVKASCNEKKSRFVESPPEIIRVLFRSYGGTCSIYITHKLSYKLQGKSFNIVTEDEYSTSVFKVTITK